ncbi:MAG: hypothetical protein J5879_02605 [Clostridia bacterium]|nr:hypothetical protein [Clostridia bacterium]
MKIRRITALALAAVTVLLLTACNVAGSNFSEKNAYVSLYVYGASGKTLFSVEALRVAPLDETTEEEETTEGGLLTEEAARQRYRTIPTPMYALELSVRAKDKNAELPSVIVTQFNGEIEYTLDRVGDHSAGKAANSNDIYEWVCTVNGEEKDLFTTKLETYDNVKIALVEKTYRNFTVTFEVLDGERTVIPETQFTVLGEKSELNISAFLESDYLDEKGEPVKPVKSALGLKLSEDGKKVIAVGDLKTTPAEGEEPTHEFVCYMDDPEEGLIYNLKDELVSERLVIIFDYREIATEDTGEATEELPEAPEE